MPPKRPMVRGDITYSAAKDEETNVLHKLSYWNQRNKFFAHLESRQNTIKSLVGHHLGLQPSECHVVDVEDWLYGSFNVCIPITLCQGSQSGRRVIMRLPLPYRVGEGFRPGNADEKLRCEAGAYIWMQENCPTVPIPRLYGFGLSTGQRVGDCALPFDLAKLDLVHST